MILKKGLTDGIPLTILRSAPADDSNFPELRANIADASAADRPPPSRGDGQRSEPRGFSPLTRKYRSALVAAEARFLSSAQAGPELAPALRLALVETVEPLPRVQISLFRFDRLAPGRFDATNPCCGTARRNVRVAARATLSGRQQIYPPKHAPPRRRRRGQPSERPLSMNAPRASTSLAAMRPSDFALARANFP